MKFLPIMGCGAYAIASLSFAVEMPQEVQALDRIYLKSCNRVCAPHMAAFMKKAAALQKKCVQNADFEAAKMIHNDLEKLKEHQFDWRRMEEPYQALHTPGWMVWFLYEHDP